MGTKALAWSFAGVMVWVASACSGRLAAVPDGGVDHGQGTGVGGGRNAGGGGGDAGFAGGSVGTSCSTNADCAGVASGMNGVCSATLFAAGPLSPSAVCLATGCAIP